MPTELLNSVVGQIISIEKAKTDRRQCQTTKPKPAPAVLPEGKHFSRCPAAAVFDPNLTDGEVRGLAAAGAFTSKDGICRASQSTIARRLGVARQTVHRWFGALVAKGYLVLERTTRRANGSRGPNVYRLVYPPLAEPAPTLPRNADHEGACYPTSGTAEICTSDAPSTNLPVATPRMTT